MNRKKTGLIFLLLVLSVLAVGYYQYNRGPVDIEHSDALSTDAQTLYLSFSRDSAQANRSYSGKVIKLTGMVESVTTNARQKQVILLASGYPGASINCTMEKPGQQVRAGQPVFIKGIVTGLGESDPMLGLAADVYMDRCYLQTH